MLSIPNFSDRLIGEMYAKKSILIGGLDPDVELIPPHLLIAAAAAHGKTLKAIAKAILSFNKQVIDAIVDKVIAVKPQIAFYEAYGSWGIWAFEETIAYARTLGLLVITDAKRGDGGKTAKAYASGHLGKVLFWGDGDDPLQFKHVDSPINVDCMTVKGYIADDCVLHFVRPVVDYGKGIFVVDKTSFKPDSRIEQLDTVGGIKVWQSLAHMVREWGEGTAGSKYGYSNVGVVLGATKDSDAPWMREHLPKALKLVPGYGGQGATADQAVAGVNADGLGIGVNDSSNLNYAYHKGQFRCDSRQFTMATSQYAEFARTDLNGALQRAGKYSF